MPDSLPAEKAVLRASVRGAVRQLTRAQKESAALDLCTRLTEQAVGKNARSVLLFSPLSDEPDIRSLLHTALAAGKLTTLPRFIATAARYEAAVIRNAQADLAEGKFGILEPSPLCRVAELNRLDLVLVPGVAFDWHGRRLGRGKGFYDRLLAEVSGKTCGVAFDQQMVEAIPVEPHDVRLNCILTPSRWLEL